VVSVSWYEAAAYARWVGGRLPAEAEWEFAARGPGGRRYPWGDQEPTADHANFGNRLDAPTPAGIYPLGSTPEGVCDLAGNVWEWCNDWFGDYEPEPQTNPVGPDRGISRVLRGGAFYSDPELLRGSFRYDFLEPGHRAFSFGFRVVWDLPLCLRAQKTHKSKKSLDKFFGPWRFANRSLHQNIRLSPMGHADGPRTAS
jgi:formylglycine-generating enzyme required for sulfatase activity